MIHAGGYWTIDGLYLGGDTHVVNIDSSLKWEKKSLVDIVISEGYTKNMDSFSYFSSEIEGTDKKMLDKDEDFVEWVSFTSGKTTRDIYVVRSDDPNLEGFKSTGNVHHDSNDESDNDGIREDSESEKEVEGVRYYAYDDELVGEHSSFHVGQVFENKESFKKVVEKYAIGGQLNIGFKKSESKKVTAHCVEEGCNWKIYASINSSSSGKFVVRSYLDEHTCSWSGKVKLYTARKIAADYVNEFKVSPMTGRVIKGRLEATRINVGPDKCQRAREICIQTLQDEYGEKFSRMFDYVLELRKSNPGSTIRLGTKAQVFEKFYACFYGQKHGWKKACRRIIHLDGTHLKGRMKGQLLSAIGRDPNDEMYPIAWAIVHVENKPNWEWFLELLRDDLEFGSGNGLTLVSDQQKGLLGAIQLVCPDVEHRMCAWHILANLKKNHGDSPSLITTFWKLSRAYNTQEFDSALEDLRMLRPDVHEAIQKYSRHWSRAFFQGHTKSDVVENNMCESFNNVITLERYKHVFVLLEFIRLYVMSNYEKKLVEIQKYKGILTPRTQAELDLRKRTSYDCQITPAGKGEYEVDHGRKKYRVNVRSNPSCACRQYDISGIPCAHIIKALREENKNIKPESHVSGWFMACRWEECYEEGLKGMNGIDMWDRTKDVKVLPPKDKIPRGRQPYNKRIRASWENKPKHCKKPKIQVTCSKCGLTGHNKQTCKYEVATSSSTAPKRGRGRPRKIVDNAEDLSQSSRLSHGS